MNTRNKTQNLQRKQFNTEYILILEGMLYDLMKFIVNLKTITKILKHRGLSKNQKYRKKS